MAEDQGVLPPKGAVAVIFVALRRDTDAEGYGVAAARMDALSRDFPGCLGFDSVRDAGGLGITVSYWRDHDSAKAWKMEAEHAAVRALGRERWYAYYRLIVASVDRAYGWAMPVD